MQARWVDTAEALDELVTDLTGVERWAFDTEFHRERTYFARLALVQIAWEDGIALVDPLRLDLHPLAAVLEGPALAVAHAADQDLEVLERACGTVPKRLFDTQVAAGFVGFSTPSLASLAERLLGLRLPKGDRLTDWNRRPLSAGQLSYGAADVAHLLDLHDRLTERLDARGRRAWAEEECAKVLARPRGPQDPDTAWWRLKDSRSLRGASRGVAQELAAWRERRAVELDVPPRFVLADLALLGIAHKPPRTVADLAEVRGLDAKQARGALGEAVLAAIGRGHDLDPSKLHLSQGDDTDRELRAAVALAAAWVAQLSRDEGIDAALLATRADLAQLLNAKQGRLMEGWRKAMVGVAVLSLAEGDAALAFDGRGGLVLEARSHQPLPIPAPAPQ
jgi:ribonuclease D